MDGCACFLLPLIIHAPVPSPRRSFHPARGLASAPEYDLVVIGGGPGGYVAAIKAAQLGMKVRRCRLPCVSVMIHVHTRGPSTPCSALLWISRHRFMLIKRACNHVVYA